MFVVAEAVSMQSDTQNIQVFAICMYMDILSFESFEMESTIVNDVFSVC